MHTRERGRVPSGLPGKRRAVRFRRRSSRWWFSRLLHGQVSLALEAVRTVHIEDGGRKEIDIKRYAKVEKIPGGDVEDSRVLKARRLRPAHSAPYTPRSPADPGR